MQKRFPWRGILARMRKTDKTEERAHPFRSEDRFFRADSAWYYSTREEDVGPFSSLEEARGHLRNFITMQKSLNDKVEELKRLREDGSRGDPEVWNRQIEVR